MGLGDVFKASENKQLKEENEYLKSMLTPEQQSLFELEQTLAELRKEHENLIKENVDIGSQIAQKKNELIELGDKLLYESFGLYEPKFDFANSDMYKAKLADIREAQKVMIKNDTAVLGSKSWAINGSTSEGKKMVRDMQKLLLRAFNSECDELVNKVTYSNYDSCVKRIDASCTAITKLGSVMNIGISDYYRERKVQELTLAFEYAQKKQQEKEEQRRMKQQLREEAKLIKEIEEERRKLEKEQTHYLNALAKINLQLTQNPDDPDLLSKKRELEEKAADAEKALRDVDYRQANKRAGYVYVISNIGAFGEDVYKIGMTRRLDPQDRIDELGDASVPFDFDVHAMIFCDDAPALESALHKAFENRKINMVNPRREFFHVSLEEIKAVVRENYDKTVEFIDIPPAEQYRISRKMHNSTSQPVSKPQQYSSQQNINNTEQPEIDDIIDQLRHTVTDAVTDCSIQDEDTPEYYKLHIYTANNQKVGYIKVSRTDYSVLFRKIIGGTPASYVLDKPEDIIKYL